MKTDKHENYITVDEKSLYSLFVDEWEWLSSFEHYPEVSGGRFNAWFSPTRWPKRPWSEMARDFSSKLQYRWNGYANRMRRRGLRAQESLEHMKYYYDAL